MSGEAKAWNVNKINNKLKYSPILIMNVVPGILISQRN